MDSSAGEADAYDPADYSAPATLEVTNSTGKADVKLMTILFLFSLIFLPCAALPRSGHMFGPALVD